MNHHAQATARELVQPARGSARMRAGAGVESGADSTATPRRRANACARRRRNGARQRAAGATAEPYTGARLGPAADGLSPAAVHQRRAKLGAAPRPAWRPRSPPHGLTALLDETVPWWFAQDNAISLVDRDDALLAQRAGAGPGSQRLHPQARAGPARRLGVPVHRQREERPAPAAQSAGRLGHPAGASDCWPAWSPLWRHIARRLAAEGALRQQMAFRTAMENSVVTGMRARDLEGRVTYVNPAFCQIVGLPQEELVGKTAAHALLGTRGDGRLSAALRRSPGGERHASSLKPSSSASDGVRVPVLIFRSAAGRQRRPPDRLDGLHPRHLRFASAPRKSIASSRKSCTPARAWPPWARFHRCWRTN